MRKISWGEYNKSLPDILIEKVRSTKISKYIKGGSVLLDLGCGFEAPFLKSISKKIKTGIGIDVSVAKDKRSKNITLVKGRVDEKIKMESNQFDAVTALAIIEHVENPEKMLKESYRLLKKGGDILITTPSKYSKPILEFLAFKLHVISQEEIGDHKRYYDIGSLRDALKKSGFINIKLEYFEFGINLFAKATK
jgi:ubiquinone/menaquinone biosynthesis C-methylase UbiE